MKKIKLKSRSKFFSRIHIQFVGSILFGILIFSSCNLDNMSNYTPKISFFRAATLQNGDSLYIKYTNTDGEYLMDTISVGDTVLFILHLNAYANNLKSLLITQSADSVSRLVLPQKSSLDSITLPISDYNVGRFVFKPDYSIMIFSFGYVAKSPTNNSKLGITLESDAKFATDLMGKSTHSFKLITPIKAHK